MSQAKVTTRLTLRTIALACADVAAMRAFYEGTLGLEFKRDLPDWLELSAGPLTLALKPIGELDAVGQGGTRHHLAFGVESPAAVDKLYEELVAAGVTIADEPRDQPWNERTCFFRDPEGNLVEAYAALDGAAKE